mmetsp:Transcript_26066/g.55013  ORF Transcript_26066/g.55013 Transcript_26066/m.55013 type:complete len:427 (-) Transcript_26066:95-1375(-)
MKTRSNNRNAKSVASPPKHHYLQTGIFIPEDAFNAVMHFLSIQDLSAMALVSKTCRQSITTTMVVQAAYRKTGDRNNTRKSMDALYTLTRQNSIHVPSPLRILRIATGNRCEICNSKNNTIASWSFGMFACWNCVSSNADTSLSKPWDTKWVRYGRNQDRYDAVLSHPRNGVSKMYGRKYYVWREHCEIAGEKVGPILAWEDVDAVVNTMNDATSLAGCIAKVDEYLDDTLHAPAIEEYNKFSSAYLAVKRDLDKRTQRKEREKVERKRVREERKRKREADQQAKEERKKKKQEAANQGEDDSVRLEEATAAAVAGDENGNEPDPVNENAQSENVKPEIEASETTNLMTSRRVCAAYKESKSNCQFSYGQLTYKKRFARCKTCIATNVPAMQRCTECNHKKKAKHFSKSVRKSDNPLVCKRCRGAN